MSSGDVLAEFTPASVEFPAANAPGLGIINNRPTVDFDATTEETGFFTGCLRPYGGRGIIIQLMWIAASATTGNLKWGVAVERNQDGVKNVSSDGFAGEQVLTVTPPGTAGIIKYTEITIADGSQMGSLANGEMFRLSVTRRNTGVSGNMTGDARLLGIQIREV